jgi:hypothetical protein
MRIGISICTGIIRRPIIAVVTTWNDSLTWVDSNNWTE